MNLGSSEGPWEVDENKYKVETMFYFTTFFFLITWWLNDIITDIADAWSHRGWYFNTQG